MYFNLTTGIVDGNFENSTEKVKLCIAAMSRTLESGEEIVKIIEQKIPCKNQLKIQGKWPWENLFLAVYIEPELIILNKHLYLNGTKFKIQMHNSKAIKNEVESYKCPIILGNSGVSEQLQVLGPMVQIKQQYLFSDLLLLHFTESLIV